MKTNRHNMITEIDKSVEVEVKDLHVNPQNPETEHKMSSGGSSQVLGDFFEFTDYLIAVNRRIRNVKTDDYYSALNSL